MNHWLIALRKNNKYYFFADSKRPEIKDGPYETVEDFIENYEKFRARKINSYKLLNSYKKVKKTRTAKSIKSKTKAGSND